MKKLVGMMMVIALGAGLAAGATYYVDYDGGSDSEGGTTEGTAWKHAPGDPSATGNADITPSAGDVIMLKGGVLYRSKININFNGASGNPVTYKGDGWGTGKAIVDGSEEVTGWTQCTGTADCLGNSNYAGIWVADAPSGVTALEANLFQGDSLLQCAQYPNLTDIFWMDDRTTYLEATSASGAAVISSDLADLGDNATLGYVYIDRSGNDVDARKITGYNGATTIQHETVSKTPTGKFSLANIPADKVFDRAGEYVVDESAGKIYLWPWDGIDPNTVTITASVREEVMQYNGSDHIVVDGIKFTRTTGKVSYANGNTGLTIKNCDFHHCRSQGIDNALDLVNQADLLVEDCTFWRNARMRGVVARRSGSTLTNCTVRNNSFVKIGRTAIFLYEVDGGEISGNYTADGRGVHSNAYSCYSDHSSDPCRDVLIKGNTALNSNNCLTFYGVDGMTIVNNLFDGTGGWPVSCWNSGNSLNVTIVHNNFVNSGTSRCGFFALPEGSASMPTAVIKNNILDGMPDYNGDISHNLYTMYATGQIMGETGGGVQFNKALIFADWQNNDWTLIAGSPAIDAGTDAGITEDMAGVTRPVGSAPDKGCYEYDPTGLGDELTEEGLALGGLRIPNPVTALAGAIVIKKAIIEKGADQVGLFTMVGQPVNIDHLQPGFYLLKNGERMRKIVVVE